MSKQLSIIEYIETLKYEKKKENEWENLGYFLNEIERKKSYEKMIRDFSREERQKRQGFSDPKYEKFTLNHECIQCKVNFTVDAIGKISDHTIGIGVYEEPSYIREYTQIRYYCPICGYPQQIAHTSLDSLKIISITVKQ